MSEVNVIDSSVSRQPGDVSPTSNECDSEHGQGDASRQSATSSYVAPALRVEELRDELGLSADDASGSSACGTDDEVAVSGGDFSDQDAGVGSTANMAYNGEFIEPEQELQQRIVAQVEQYFADENIIHDTFMLKHVRRNRLGFVSLKLVSSFRKVKPLTRDYRVVAHSLRQFSERLEVNEEGTKVRRRDPLPEFDETTPSRTLIVAGLPMEVPTMENVSEQFAGCGEIVSIRIWRPGKPLPSDVKKHISNHGSEYLDIACAVIEFDEHQSAVKACEQVAKANMDGLNGKMRASLQAASKSEHSKKTEKGSGPTRKNVDHNSGSENWRDGAGKNHESKEKSSKNKNSTKTEWRRSGRVNELTVEPDVDSAGSESDASADNWRTAKRPAANGNSTSRNSLSPQVDPNRLSPSQSPRTTPKSSPRTSPNMRRRTLGTSPLAADSDERRKSDGSIASPSQSPWVQRRLKAQEASISPLAGNSPGSSPRLARKAPNDEAAIAAGSKLFDAVGVVRQPKGPDGTRGFNNGGGRGQISTESEESTVKA